MTSYTAYFYTDAEYASTEIEAATPKEALALAREMDQGGTIIGFEHYDEPHPVNHIEILDEDCNELAHWRDADLLLRMAAPHLLTALKGALFALDRNQEGSGPSKAEAIKQARVAIAMAEPGQP